MERVTSCRLIAPRGVLPVLLYMALAFTVPLLYFYVHYDFTSDIVRGVTIGISGAAAIAVVFANNCCCWYNMMLAFHTALEVRVVERAITFAYDASTPDFQMAWALTGAIIVIVHLVPFYVTDNVLLLGTLAVAGTMVNTALLVYLEPTLLLLLVGASSIAVLAVTLLIAGVCRVDTSLLSVLRDALNARSLVTCDTVAL